MESIDSQERQILAYLQSGRTLTPLDALRLFGVFRLGARIFDLKKKGYLINSTMIQVNNKRVASYQLIN